MDTVELDARRLKALAHPLRIRLLGLLRMHGPATATALAQQVGDTTSGTTSWHLRRLAEHGFVREAAAQPSGRERRWEAAHQLTNLDTPTMLADPDTRGAAETFLQHVLEAQFGWVRAWLAEQPTADQEWVAASTFHDRILRLSPERLAMLGKELTQVLDAYQTDPDTDAAARQVAVVLHAFPYTGEPPSPEGR